MSTTEQPAPPVDRVISGQLVGVEARTAGWHRFSIQEPGKEWPYKADTKKKTIIDAAMSMMNQEVVAKVKEQTSTTVNEHSGEFFVNKYLNEIAPQTGGVHAPESQTYEPTTRPQTVQEASAQSVGQPASVGYEKELRIMRQTASKAAAMMYPHLPEEQRNSEGLIGVCEVLMHYYQYGPYRFGISPAGKEGEPVPNPMQAMQDRSELEHGDVVDGVSEEAFIQSLGTVTEGQPCELCGFVGTHAIACPNGDFA